MFIAGFDPAYVERAPLHRLIFWHRRFFEFAKRRHASRETLITDAVKMLRP